MAFLSVWRRVIVFVFLLLLAQTSALQAAQPQLGLTGWRLERVVGDYDGTSEVVEPGEAFNLYLTFRNPSATDSVTSTEVRVSTATPGILVADERTQVPDMVPGAEGETISPVYFHVAPDFLCGDYIDFEVQTRSKETDRTFRLAFQAGREVSQSNQIFLTPSEYNPPVDCMQEGTSTSVQEPSGAITLPRSGGLVLRWFQRYDESAPEPSTLDLEFSEDGETWAVLYQADAETGNTWQEYDLSNLAVAGPFFIRWRSEGAYCYADEDTWTRWFVERAFLDGTRTVCDSTTAACLNIETIFDPVTDDNDSVIERGETVTMTLMLRNSTYADVRNLLGSISVDPTSATLLAHPTGAPLVKPELYPFEGDAITFRFQVPADAPCGGVIPFMLDLQSDRFVCSLPIPVTIGLNPVIMETDFESLAYWNLSGLWHTESNSPCLSPIAGSFSGTSALVLNSAGTCDYNTGARIQDTAGDYNAHYIPYSPTGVELSWQQVLITESATNYDIASLEISTDWGSSWTSVWTVPRSSSWEKRSFDLTAYQGQYIMFRFLFDSIDAQDNQYAGWYIDDVRIALREPHCISTADPLRPALCNTMTALAPIPDFGGGPLTLTQELSNEGRIDHLRVGLRIDHPRVGDLRVTLKHADTGTTVLLINRPVDESGGSTKGSVGGPIYCFGEDIAVELDSDTEDTSVQTRCDLYWVPAISGTAKPAESLFRFHAEPIAGTWILMVEDLAGGAEGFVREWCLRPSLIAPNADPLTVTASLSNSGPFEPGDTFDVHLAVTDNTSGRVPAQASLELAFPTNAVEILAVEGIDLGMATPEPPTFNAGTTVQLLKSGGNPSATKPFPRIFRVEMLVRSSAPPTFSMTVGQSPDGETLLSQNGFQVLAAALDDTALQNLQVVNTATPTPTATAIPTCAPGLPYTATPSPAVSPTITPTATPAVTEAAVLSVSATDSEIVAAHTDFADLLGRRQFIGFWSRLQNDPSSPWVYYGYVEYSAGSTSTTMPWTPEPSSAYDVAARRFVQGAGWSGPSIYGRYTNFEDDVYPTIGWVSSDTSPSIAVVAFDTTGTLPCSIGYWTRPLTTYANYPPNPTEPNEGWTYHGLTPYPLASDLMILDGRFNADAETEIAAQVYVKGRGFVGPYVINYAPEGTQGFPKPYGIRMNHSTGIATLQFSPVGNLNCNIGFWFRELDPNSCQPLCDWSFLGFEPYEKLQRNVEFPWYPSNPDGVYQGAMRLHVYRYQGEYTGWISPFFIVNEPCFPNFGND